MGEELPRRAALFLGPQPAALGTAEGHVWVGAGGLGVDVEDSDINTVNGLQSPGEVLGENRRGESELAVVG